MYPLALAHLANARNLKTEMAELWGSALASGLMETSVHVNADGVGQIYAHSDWEPTTRTQLTAAFTGCVAALWSCLDSLVSESVTIFSVQKQPKNVDRPRFFPVADSLGSFEDLLEQSCMDGILNGQARMIVDCQPFQTEPNAVVARHFRDGIRQLLAWSNALDSGEVVGAWATPTSPQVRAEPPIEVAKLNLAPAGELTPRFLVADFELSNFEVGAGVTGQAGTYVDLGFAPGFYPTALDDTFEKRLDTVCEIVRRFVLGFTIMARKAPGAKRVLEGAGGRSGSWVEAAKSERHWTAEEINRLAESETGLGVVSDAEELTLLVSTPGGVFERSVPSATPLRSFDRRGIAAETAVQDAASTWGLPDFVFAPSVERKGSGVREISDGLIVVGNRGAIIQVKAREAEPRSVEREELWITGQIASGLKQAVGTRRRVGAQPIQMVNGRGRTISVSGPDIDWVGVVIIDHPSPPKALKITGSTATMPHVVLLRRDWEFLFTQLKSTHAVVEYLHRVAAPTEILGEEPHRYYELAAADAAAKPSPTLTPIAGKGVLRSVPLLPSAPAGNDKAHGMIRHLLEEIATSPLGEAEQEKRQEFLASIDSLPVGHRAELGDLLLTAMAQARETPEGNVRWQFRTLLAAAGKDQLTFGVCSTLTEDTKAAFQARLILLHEDRRNRENIDTATSIGVLLTPRTDGYRDFDTTMIALRGDLGVPESDMNIYRNFWDPNSSRVAQSSAPQSRHEP